MLIVQVSTMYNTNFLHSQQRQSIERIPPQGVHAR